ncbi:hypothetical protein [uncultured Roseobacter sp.]|uniref:hypothetical protein n=1 Tax=uncultured Roseobacter sp. TaxID=114847 RepID=UPI00262AA9CA|nr:hypothetical protein [uncultured Roseobacter sp.]
MASSRTGKRNKGSDDPSAIRRVEELYHRADMAYSASSNPMSQDSRIDAEANEEHRNPTEKTEADLTTESYDERHLWVISVLKDLVNYSAKERLPLVQAYLLVVISFVEAVFKSEVSGEDSSDVER